MLYSNPELPWLAVLLFFVQFFVLSRRLNCHGTAQFGSQRCLPQVWYHPYRCSHHLLSVTGPPISCREMALLWRAASLIAQEGLRWGYKGAAWQPDGPIHQHAPLWALSALQSPSCLLVVSTGRAAPLLSNNSFFLLVLG